ncbi:hypothetical protein FKM82_029081 [Ascaphus truei]
MQVFLFCVVAFLAVCSTFFALYCDICSIDQCVVCLPCPLPPWFTPLWGSICLGCCILIVSCAICFMRFVCSLSIKLLCV